jgi:hypothetical protein
VLAVDDQDPRLVRQDKERAQILVQRLGLVGGVHSRLEPFRKRRPSEGEDRGIRVPFDHRLGRGDAREECLIDGAQLGQAVDLAIPVLVKSGVEIDRAQVRATPFIRSMRSCPCTRIRS